MFPYCFGVKKDIVEIKLFSNLILFLFISNSLISDTSRISILVMGVWPFWFYIYLDLRKFDKRNLDSRNPISEIAIRTLHSRLYFFVEENGPWGNYP